VEVTDPHTQLDDLQRLLWGFAGQRIITVAGRAGILGLLAERQADPDDVAKELDLDPLATGKIVRALCAQGLLETDGEGYRMVETLRPFFIPGPGDFSAFLEHLHSMYERWGENLEPWLRGEGWSTAPRTPEETARFGAAMAAMGSQIARRVAGALDLGGVRTMLDVGGGWGQYAKAMCAIWPELHATVLDIPQVAEAAPGAVVGTGFEGRISWIGGDYLETDYGGGYDLVLLANILHQELAPRAAEIIRRAAAALAPGGRVAVVDFAIDDAKREHPFGTLFAINMRSFGDTYSEPELRGWMEDAGLDNVTTTFIGSDRWVVSGTRS
jgi:ubiquinone/menaquinone biosynthesis C-methylase UbiE/predicted transcriptional regulator